MPWYARGTAREAALPARGSADIFIDEDNFTAQHIAQEMIATEPSGEGMPPSQAVGKRPSIAAGDIHE